MSFITAPFLAAIQIKIELQNTYVDPSIFVGMLDRGKHSNIGIHLFQQLYHNSIAMNQWEFADTAEFNRKKWTRYVLNYKRRENQIGKIEHIAKWTRNCLFYLLVGYGVRFKFIAFWAATGIIAFLILNYALWSDLGIVGKSGPVEEKTFVAVLYYTATIPSGLGEFTPTSDAGRLLFLLEAFFALIIGSFFVTWLVKRTVR